MRISPKATTLIVLAAALAVTALVYGPGLSGGYVFDDYPNIVDNAGVHLTQSTLANWANAAWSSPSSSLHRPLASLTFAANWFFSGADPGPMKAVNIGIHLLNGVLLYFMLRELLRAWNACRSRGRETNQDPSFGTPQSGDPESALVSWKSRFRVRPFGPPRNDDNRSVRGAAGNAWREGFKIDEVAAHRLALLVAAGWLLLPINLMAVLYVVQRMESLCQVFVLAGLWGYLHGRRRMLTATDAAGERIGLVQATLGIILGTGIGLLSKESSVLLPIYALLAEWVLLGFGINERHRHDIDKPLSRERGRDEGVNPAEYPDTAGPSSDAERHQDAFAGYDRRNESEPLSPRERGRGEGTSPAKYPENAEFPPGAARHRDASAGYDRRDEDQPLSLRESGRDEGTNPAQYPDNAEVLPSAARHRAAFAGYDRRVMLLFVFVLLVPAVLGLAWLLPGTLSPSAWDGRSFTLGERLLTEGRVLVKYLRWTLFPDPVSLSLYHDEMPLSTGLLKPWTTLPAILFLAALLGLAAGLRKRRPLISLGILWFFAAQLLTATVIPLELVYEHRNYFASIGVLLAAFSIVLGLRRTIVLPIVRGTLVAVLLMWCAGVTYLRAQDWSDPLRLALSEANRHPGSPRANYEAGRLLLISADYEPGELLDKSRFYLHRAGALPGSSALAEQALIMIDTHEGKADDAAVWDEMIAKLRNQPTTQEDISALISLSQCRRKNDCHFDIEPLRRAFLAALSRPNPIARLYSGYADFAYYLLHDDALAIDAMRKAVKRSPSEPAYHVQLAHWLAIHGMTEEAVGQIDALRRLDSLGRLDAQIEVLEQQAERGGPPLKH